MKIEDVVSISGVKLNLRFGEETIKKVHKEWRKAWSTFWVTKNERRH